MALASDIAAQLKAMARQARSLGCRDSRLFLELGELVAKVHALLDAAGAPKEFAGWCRDSRLGRQEAYKAMSAWRRLGDAPGAANQPRTVLELLGSSEKAAEEARPLLVNRLTIREAQAILERHRAPRLAKAPVAVHVQSFETAGGTVVIRFAGDEGNLLGAMLQVVRQLQSAAVVKAPEPSKSIFGRLAG